MTQLKLMPALAFAAAGITASGIALTALPAHAATGHPTTKAPAHPAVHAAPSGKLLTKSQQVQARAQQRQMAASSTRPTFAKAGVKTFTVTTTEDSDLATPTGTTCVDASTGKCSLRAAVNAANNLEKPVRIVLGKHTYTLSLAAALSVANHHGTSIVGQGTSKTSIAGAGSGLFYVSNSTAGPAALFLSSLTLKNGSASDGGAIETADDEGVALNLDHVALRNNTASTAGGAIYAYGYNTVYISDSTFTGNHAPSGGAIYQYWSNLDIADTTFTSNSTTAGANGYGGAVYNYYGVFDMTGGSMTGNEAGDATYYGAGGAIYDYGSTTTLTGVHVDNNSAHTDGEGGAIYAYYDLLTVDHGSMSHNKTLGTSASGGAVYTYYNSQLTFSHATLAGNHAGGDSDFYGGGTVYSYGYEYPVQITVDHSKVTGSNASAFYLVGYEGLVDATITHSTLSKNVSAFHNGYDGQGCGGAVCAYGYYYGSVHLDMEHNQVTGNGGVGDGGSGAVTGYGYEYAMVAASFSHNTFANNHAGAGGYGGALGFYTYSSDDSPISVRLSANKFTGNRAGTQGSPGYGGAVSAYYAVSIADQGSTYSKNRAVGDGAVGGAIADVGYYGTLKVSRSTFTGNSAGTNQASNSGYGGAVATSAENGTVLDQVTIAGNKSASYGGGVYADDYGYQVRITASTISGNSTGSAANDGYGGGIYTEDAVLTLQNATVTGNKANGTGYGGGIYFAGSTVGLRYSTISGNYAKQGAGVYSDYLGSILGTILSGNKTAKHGAEKDCGIASTSYKLVSYGGNVIGQGTCVVARQSSDKVAKNAHLGKLKDNGGPTKTMAISKKSPAVGRASYLVPAADQRGHKRPSKHADAGAYELPKSKKKKH
ncbi:MAG: choice-of-anchor Q domain-containing protein [Nocardioides sp.]